MTVFHRESHAIRQGARSDMIHLQPVGRARLLFLAVLLCTWAFGSISNGQSTRSAPPVNVILWFDTEDYLLPADDDADKRIADMLAERHIRATFKVVGEKARELE